MKKAVGGQTSKNQATLLPSKKLSGRSIARAALRGSKNTKKARCANKRTQAIVWNLAGDDSAASRSLEDGYFN